MIRLLLPAVLAASMAVRAAAPEPGQLDASPTLFTVMAALNAVGYDVDLASPTNHPLRMAIRKALEQKKLPSLEPIRAFFQPHRKKNDTLELSQYISWALSVSGPPNFEMRHRTVDTAPDALALADLGPLLAAFYSEAGIEDLWKRSQPAIEQYIGLYHEPVLESILQVNSYLRNVTSGMAGWRFQIFVELLAPPNLVQTRSYGGEYYIVVTPSPEPRIHDVRHAYLHFLIDPLATRSAEVLDRKRALIDHAQRAPLLGEAYKSDFLQLAGESLIKVVESRLDRKPEEVQEALLEGFVLAPYFAEQMPLYEKQESAMRFYFPEMVKAIDMRREEARLANVEFAKEARVRVARPATLGPPEPVLTGAAKTLDDAEKLYAARDLEKSKQAFLRVLQETEDKPQHAQAYYGLARIAVLQKDPEMAERMFQKTLEGSPPPQVKAWALVYLGRLSDAAGDREQAARHYQSALAVAGASAAAREAAEQGAKQSFKRQ